jgi:hypothetical protein
VPVVIEGVDAQLNVHWSRIDDSFSSRVGEISVNYLADCMIMVDFFRDITVNAMATMATFLVLLCHGAG